MKTYKLEECFKISKSAGVYWIKNLLNGKTYVGSSANLKRRICNHIRLLRNDKHPNKHLQGAYNKYGENVFEFAILEICDAIKDTLLYLEQKYIDEINPEYNKCPKAYSLLGFKHTKEFCEKCKLRDMSHLFTQDVCKKRGDSIRQLKYKPIQQFDLDGNLLGTYPSQIHAALALGNIEYRKNISACCLNKQKTAYGFKWRFKK